MSKVVSLICSHNSRIQCLLDKLTPTTATIRFQNCAILRMSIKLSACSVTLVHSGELSPKEKEKVSEKRPYYSNEPTSGYEPTPGYTQFNTIGFNYTQLGLTIPEGKEYVFYIVRHGQAEHNVKNLMGVSSTMGMKYDTNLTDLGKDQAYNTGRKLFIILKENVDDNFDVLFSSDLIRSRQTIMSVLHGINDKYAEDSEMSNSRSSSPITIPSPSSSQITTQSRSSPITIPSPSSSPITIPSSSRSSSSSLSSSPITIPSRSPSPLSSPITVPSLITIPDQKIIVLPCASEVADVGNGTGNCDSANAIGGLARENYPSCTKAIIETQPCNFIDNITVDWSFYLEFYGGLTRRDYMNLGNRFNSKRRKCRETNMISCAIEYLGNQPQQSPRPVTPGGAKRRKATKKRTRKTKKRVYKKKTKRRR